jgi:hypothetical protein
MDCDQGVLHTVPIPGALAYLMLRPLLADVPAGDMLRRHRQPDLPRQRHLAPTAHAGPQRHPRRPGRRLRRWHCDMIHSVAPVQDQQGWDNVMYIPAARWCPRNEHYAAGVRNAFLTGSSPSDFPAEHYERSWTNRFQLDDLNDTGRRGLGLD